MIKVSSHPVSSSRIAWDHSHWQHCSAKYVLSGANYLQSIGHNRAHLVIPRFEGVRTLSLDHESARNIISCRFERFAELPLELRQQIYDETRPDSRLLSFDDVQIECKADDISNQIRSLQLRPKVRSVKKDDDDETTKPSDTALSLPWVMLAVNKETREWAHRNYRLSFQGRLVRGIGGVYIDFDRDTLLFSSHLALLAMFAVAIPKEISEGKFDDHASLIPPDSEDDMEENASKVQNLVIGTQLTERLILILTKFTDLKQVEFCQFFSSTTRIQPDALVKKWEEQRAVSDTEEEAPDNGFKGRDNQVVGIEEKLVQFPEVKFWEHCEFINYYYLRTGLF